MSYYTRGHVIRGDEPMAAQFVFVAKYPQPIRDHVVCAACKSLFNDCENYGCRSVSVDDDSDMVYDDPEKDFIGDFFDPWVVGEITVRAIASDKYEAHALIGKDGVFVRSLEEFEGIYRDSADYDLVDD